MRHDYGIKPKPISVINLQAIAIVEHNHQVIANMIWTFELETNYLDIKDPWKGMLSVTVFAVRLRYHINLKKTPSQIVFGKRHNFSY